VRTFRGLQLRADISRLKLRNRFSRSAVATGRPGVIVSLTTYDKRVGVVHLAIESIARGHAAPSRLILWLDDTALLANLPQPLLRLQKRGLEIRQCKNYGPYKKYYSYLEREQVLIHPLVTADDDVIYPPSWLAGLIAANRQFPNCVNCYRARQMMLRDGKFAPYREWPLCESTAPRFSFMATGVSGAIYPAALLGELKRAGTGFEARSPRSDDLWLHVWTIRSNFKIRQIQPQAIHFPLIPGSQAASLCAENCGEDEGNDRQIALVYEPRDLDFLERSTVTAFA
jgi:hypothetical protein